MSIAYKLLPCVLAITWSAAHGQTEQGDPRRAVVLAIEGKAYALANANQPRALCRAEQLAAGAEIETDKNSKVDLYFRQIGTVVRLMPGTRVKLEKLAKFYKEGVLLKETELSLPKGRLLCCVRTLVPDSKFEVRTPTAVFQMPTAGVGRYDIRGDGTVIVGKKSGVALRAIVSSGTPSTNLVKPGQQLNARSPALIPVAPQVLEELLVSFDEMQLIEEGLTPPPRPEELPRK